MKAFEIVELEQSNDDLVVLALRGYLDAHTVGDFEAYMDQSIERDRVNYLIDISDLNYMSSAGIGAIMSLTQRLRRVDGEVVLLRPSEKVFRILDKLGFTKIFRLAYSQEEARKLLNR